MTKTYERRYHATWTRLRGPSPLYVLGRWTHERKLALVAAPVDLLLAAVADVTDRLPRVAAREPTRRHRKHFAWLLGWKLRIDTALEGRRP